MLERRRITKILKGYIAHEQYASRESLDALRRNEYIYKSPNPYRHEMRHAILNYKTETIKSAFLEIGSVLHKESNSDVQLSILRLFFDAAFTRNDASLFSEPVLYGFCCAHGAAQARLSTLSVYTLALPIESYGGNHFILHEIINNIGKKGAFHDGDGGDLIKTLLSRGDEEGARLVIHYSNKESLAMSMHMSDLYAEHGEYAIITLCKEGVELLPNALPDEAVDEIFGDPKQLPHSLDPSLVSALPLIVNRIAKAKDICPLSFASELPEWQRDIAAKTLLETMC